MTISQHQVTAELNVGFGHELNVISATITLDDAWSPYVQATLTLHTPDETVLDLLDPRDNVRVVVTVTKTFSNWNTTGVFTDQERIFNLLLRSRTVDHITGTTLVTLASDEAALQEFALIATTSERVNGLSVKTAVEHALGKIGATLEPGASDANVQSKPALPSYTNLVPNPSAEVDLTGWVPAGGFTTLTRVTTQHWVGSACFQGRADSDYVSPGPSMTAAAAAAAGTTYTLSAYVKTNVSRTVNITMRFFGPGGVISTHIESKAIVAGADWVRVSVTAVAPAGTTSISGFSHIVSATTGNTGWWDGFMITATPTVIDYFDGTTTDTLEYDFAWSSTAHNSASTKTWIPTSDAMVWSPGDTGWDFLEPLFQSVGLRLYCNESREWILEPSGTTREGQINVAEGFNLTEGTDTISRDGEWFDAVVVKYTGNVAGNGQKFTSYDIAGISGTKALVVEYDRVSPGPGAAQSILDRAIGKGRLLGLTGISDYEVTPGMTVVATLPNSPIQSGLISSVEWLFPVGTMTIGSRGLTDTAPASWLLATDGVGWEDVPTGTDWTEYDPDTL